MSLKMKEFSLSPKVPIESQTSLRIPIFTNNASRVALFKNQTIIQSSNHSFRRGSTRRSMTEGNIPSSICKCPKVLIADDDAFQLFYYQAIFQKSLDLKTSTESSKSLGVHSCGEDLLEHYQRIKTCGCGSVKLVISDYNMGPKKLNGVQTIISLREIGYEGAVMLRTSEKKEDLDKENENFTTLLEKKTIDSYVEKHNHNKTKEVIGNFLGRRSL